MARKGYAKRYAQAAFEIALGKGELDRWQSDLEKIVRLSKDAVFTLLLENPKIHFEDKAKLLSEELAGINSLALNLVYLLIARDVWSMAGDIAEQFQRLVDDYHGLEPAKVVTAIPLSDEEKLRLEERLGAMVGKKVVIESKVDPGLLGGIVARVGGKLLDGSTRSRLEGLKKELSGVAR